MARIPTTASPLAGIDDDELTDEEIDALMEQIVPLGDDIVTLERATLTSFALLRSGLGVEVKFVIPLTEKEKLPHLTNALQRLVDVKVTRHRRHRDAS